MFVTESGISDLMILFDNIFISTYRAYKRKNDSPRVSEMIFVYICIAGFISLIVESFHKLWGIDIRTRGAFLLRNPILLVLLALAIMFLLYQYYSEQRIEKLLVRFEQKTHLERNLWGWISVMTLILPIVAFAIILNRSQN